jgi:hypothetical protein
LLEEIGILSEKEINRRHLYHKVCNLMSSKPYIRKLITDERRELVHNNLDASKIFAYLLNKKEKGVGVA